MDIINQKIGTVGNVDLSVAGGKVLLASSVGEDLGALADKLAADHASSPLIVEAAALVKAAVQKADVNILDQHLGTVGEIKVGLHQGAISLSLEGGVDLADLVSKLEADHAGNALVTAICEGAKAVITAVK